MDIEQVAKDDPKKIQTTAIDIMEGLSRSTAESIAKFLEFDKGSVDQVRFWIFLTAFYFKCQAKSGWDFILVLNILGDESNLEAL
jgi:succinyl-CoA synthetase beta subunit